MAAYRTRRGRATHRGSPETDAALRRLERLAWLLDASIGIPGTRFRFGIDPLIGLIPGIGDVAGGALSAFLVYEAWRLGAPPRLLARMVANVAAEMAIGAVPLAGDVFDAWYKANQRNVAILRAYLDPPSER